MSKLSSCYLNTFKNILECGTNCLYEVGQIDKIISREKLQNRKVIFSSKKYLLV